jgi:hypothetical protein
MGPRKAGARFCQGGLSEACGRDKTRRAATSSRESIRFARRVLALEWPLGTNDQALCEVRTAPSLPARRASRTRPHRRRSP